MTYSLNLVSFDYTSFISYEGKDEKKASHFLNDRFDEYRYLLTLNISEQDREFKREVYSIEQGNRKSKSLCSRNSGKSKENVY